MKSSEAKKAAAWLILGILASFVSAESLKAETIVKRICRGVQLDLYIDPGDTYIVYYWADGRPAVMSYRRNWITNPYTVASIYVRGAKKWYSMYRNQLVEPFHWKRAWFGISRRAVYAMVISNKRDSALVHIRVR